MAVMDEHFPAARTIFVISASDDYGSIAIPAMPRSRGRAIWLRIRSRGANAVEELNLNSEGSGMPSRLVLVSN
jgi:hypothetical protein